MRDGCGQVYGLCKWLTFPASTLAIKRCEAEFLQQMSISINLSMKLFEQLVDEINVGRAHNVN